MELPDGEPVLRVVPMPADVTKPAAVVGCFRKAIAEFGGVDIVINNAGVVVPGRVPPGVILQALRASPAGFESRSSRRRILPTFDFGRSVRNSMYFGFL